MSQAKKNPSPSSSAKLTSNASEKITKNAFSAVESGRNAAENVVRISGSAVRDFVSSSAGEAKKAQEKAYEMSREHAEQFSKSADAMTKFLAEAVSMSRGNLETCVECGNMSASFVRDLSSEAFEAANRSMSESMDMSKEFFKCRTLNDTFEVQNRMFRQTMESFFSQSTRMSNMMFEFSSDALEPINERVSEATEQFSKAISA